MGEQVREQGKVEVEEKVEKEARSMKKRWILMKEDSI